MLFQTSSPPPEPMGDFTGFLLNVVGTRSRTAFATALGRIGMKPPHFGVLVMIDAHPGMAQNELVAATQIDPSTMVAMLDGLEAGGLAERRAHPSDRRKHALHLTAAGAGKLTAARHAAREVADDVFGVLEPAELTELHRLLRKLAGFSDDADGPAPVLGAGRPAPRSGASG